MRRRQVLALPLAACAALGLGAGAAFAAPKPAQKVKLDDACSLVLPARIVRAFGGPVVRHRAGPLPTRVCYVDVGANKAEAPGGTLTASFEYIKGDDTASDAQEGVERIVDPDVAGGVKVEAVEGVGKLAYAYPDDGGLLVAVGNRFAFRLLWAPASQPAPLTAQARKALVKLAKDAVKRG